MSIYTVDAYLKRNEVLMNDTTCMDLKNMVLSEKSQAQKFTYSMIPFIWNIQKRQKAESGGQSWGRVLKGNGKGVTANGCSLSFGGEGKCSKTCGDGCTTL